MKRHFAFTESHLQNVRYKDLLSTTFTYTPEPGPIPGFLTRALDLSHVDALNREFVRWVEDEYNGREHATLAMRPIDRFGLDLSRIRFLPPNQTNDELFFVEQDRTVLADNTFSLKGMRYEAPRDLHSRKIQVRFDRGDFGRVIVYFKGERMGEARPVDFHANDRKPAANETTP